MPSLRRSARCLRHYRSYRSTPSLFNPECFIVYLVTRRALPDLVRVFVLAEVEAVIETMTHSVSNASCRPLYDHHRDTCL